MSRPLSPPLSLRLYGLATALAEPLAPLLLKSRVRRGKEDAARLGERMGHASIPRPDGPLAWLHGASVGESLSLLPLVERLRKARPDMTVLVTSGTVTSAALLARRLPEGAIHQYAPVDAPAAARRFLDHWKPDLAVFVESELWPNLLLGAKARGAKLALISARIGEGSARTWARAPKGAAALMSAFDLVLPQDDEAAWRLGALGARDDGRLNLKYAGDALPADPAALEILTRAVGARPLLLAASTHPGEEEIVLAAFSAHLGHAGAPLLVIVPRHPDRGHEVVELARNVGFTAALRSVGEPLAAATQVYVADTLGELGVWMRLARTCLVAGSLVPDIGGHNPLEPARLGCPVLTGPHVANWQGVYDELIAADEVRLVVGGPELSVAFGDALAASDERRATAALATAARKKRSLESGFTQVQALAPARGAS